MKKGDKIKVHMYDSNNKEIITRNRDKIFTVYEKDGGTGIDYDTSRSPYTCKGGIFTPFYTFASTVIFENVETGEKYYFSNIKNEVVKI